MAAHGAQADGGLRKLLGVVGTSACPARQDGDVVVLAQDAGDLTQGLGVDAANLAGPLGGLGHTVVLAAQVTEEVLVGRGVGGHVVGVLANAAAVQEVPVDERAGLAVLLEHDVGHGHHGRHVGGGANRHPLGVENGRSVGVNRVEDDELDAGVLPGLGEVRGVAQGGPSGVVAEGDHVVAVQHVETVVVDRVVVAAVAPAEHARSVPAAPRGGRPRGEVVDVELVEQAGHAAAQSEDGVVAKLAVDALDLVMDVLGSLVPRDALPLVDAAKLGVRVLGAPVLALHGVLQAVEAASLVLLRPAAQAGPLLAVDLVVGVDVVGLLTDDDAVLRADLDEALAAAVVPASGGMPLALLVGLHLVGQGHTQVVVGRAAHRRQTQACRPHGRNGASQELTPAEPGFQCILYQCHKTVLLSPCLTKPTCNTFMPRRKRQSPTSRRGPTRRAARSRPQPAQAADTPRASSTKPCPAHTRKPS